MQTREKLKTLSIYYQNVSGLRTKAGTFFEGVALSDYDVYCITETWLLSDITSYEYFCDSYSIFRRVVITELPDRNTVVVYHQPYATTLRQFVAWTSKAMKNVFGLK